MTMHTAQKNKDNVIVSAARWGFSLTKFSQLEKSLNDWRVNALSTPLFVQLFSQGLTQDLAYSNAPCDAGIKKSYEQRGVVVEHTSAYISAIEFRGQP